MSAFGALNLFASINAEAVLCISWYRTSLTPTTFNSNNLHRYFSLGSLPSPGRTFHLATVSPKGSDAFPSTIMQTSCLFPLASMNTSLWEARGPPGSGTLYSGKATRTSISSNTAMPDLRNTRLTSDGKSLASCQQ